MHRQSNQEPDNDRTHVMALGENAGFDWARSYDVNEKLRNSFMDTLGKIAVLQYERGESSEASTQEALRAAAYLIAPDLVDERDDLQREAETDALTGLGNERAFQRAVDRALAEGYVICLFDLRDFKRFNDEKGQKAGDEKIKTAGNAINEHSSRGFRIGDDITSYRKGGDEFAVLVKEDEANGTIAEVIQAFGEQDGTSLRGAWGKSYEEVSKRMIEEKKHEKALPAA